MKITTIENKQVAMNSVTGKFYVHGKHFVGTVEEATPLDPAKLAVIRFSYANVVAVSATFLS